MLLKGTWTSSIVQREQNYHLNELNCTKGAKLSNAHSSKKVRSAREEIIKSSSSSSAFLARSHQGYLLHQARKIIDLKQIGHCVIDTSDKSLRKTMMDNSLLQFCIIAWQNNWNFIWTFSPLLNISESTAWHGHLLIVKLFSMCGTRDEPEIRWP